MKYIIILLAIVTLASCTEQSSTHSGQVNTGTIKDNSNEALENLGWMFIGAGLNAATSNTTEIHNYYETSTTPTKSSKSTSSQVKTTNDSGKMKSSGSIKSTPKPVDKPKEIKAYGGGGFTKPTSSSIRSPRSSSKSPVRR